MQAQYETDLAAWPAQQAGQGADIDRRPGVRRQVEQALRGALAKSEAPKRRKK